MSTDNTTYHIPVLLESAVNELDIQPSGTYCDLTFGGGGHSRHILSTVRATPSAKWKPNISFIIPKPESSTKPK